MLCGGRPLSGVTARLPRSLSLGPTGPNGRCDILRLTRPKVVAACFAAACFASHSVAGDCPADLNADGVVDGADLAAVLGGWGTAGSSDVTGDGVTDAADISIVLGGWGPCPTGSGVIERELAAISLSSYPWASFVQSFNRTSTVRIAVDPAQVPTAANATTDVFVVEDRSSLEWASNPTLTDVRGTPDVVTFGASIDASVLPLATTTLPATNGLNIGKGYDLVVDVNRNGLLDAGDLIDGAEGPGFWIVSDLTAAGPLAVSQINSFDTNYASIAAAMQLERIYYPTDIQNMTPVPLVRLHRPASGELGIHRDVAPERHRSRHRNGKHDDTAAHRCDHRPPSLDRRRGVQRKAGLVANHVDRPQPRWRGDRASIRPYLRRHVRAVELLTVEHQAPIEHRTDRLSRDQLGKPPQRSVSPDLRRR